MMSQRLDYPPSPKDELIIGGYGSNDKECVRMIQKLKSIGCKDLANECVFKDLGLSYYGRGFDRDMECRLVIRYKHSETN